ncbi:SDR family NAD(P)-dependent oxidoreductase [Burkholderia sp. Bp8963]|uniref:SDR family NAD(P)-dependent oxidoreductase n=1 Tax=Burkholderia sp. Bp8963 TaxID=2184547 RepID=UPI000F5B59F7|nr:SDR family oxidoreductase [Burkholderia sp. Bp8963]RQS68668.1 SDR family NAD(P)-dependent oxidoreductase [Burkholderia sp. Bp8963]
MSNLILKDKVVLVTGAAGGFGRRTCEELAKAGAWVVATDVDRDGAAETASQCAALGAKAWSHAHDVTSEADWRRVIDAVAEQAGGRLDGLVNNAGKMLTKPFLRTSVAELRQLQAINVESVWIGSQTAYPLLEHTAKVHGGASIVNVSSVFGQVAAVAQAAYSATKGGLTVLTKSMAAEFARAGCGVRVNSVHPGPGNTPLLANGLQELLSEGLATSPQQATAFVLGLIPNGRLTEPEDVANAILFLCSDWSKQITGAEITVDGGYTAV